MDRKFILPNGAEIKMRSMDNPDRIRGIELAWFGIDEGRNFSDGYAYDVMVGRLRQGGYNHAGWVCSTPHGFDWMWKKFHPEAPAKGRLTDAAWYNAPTYQNAVNLPPNYIDDLEAQYHGKWHDQEVKGEFVGVVDGAVFPEFDRNIHVRKVEYNPDLPLYSFWDFGIGDAGVCLFAQVAWHPEEIGNHIFFQPQLRIIGSIEMANKTVAQWADAYFKWLRKNVDGRMPDNAWGDPAGDQRNPVTGTSVLKAFPQHGIRIRPAPRRPRDEGHMIVQNLMENPLGFVIDEREDRVIQAVQTYHWKVDDDGNRIGNDPVHDWTSHFCTALCYGALGVIGLHPRRMQRPAQEPQRGTWGYTMNQLLVPTNEVPEMSDGAERPVRIDWHRDEPVGVEGWLNG